MALIVHPAFTHTLAVKPDPPPSHFDALPMDALLHISKFVAAACDHGTLCSLSAVNVRCRHAGSSQDLWRRMCLTRFAVPENCSPPSWQQLYRFNHQFLYKVLLSRSGERFSGYRVGMPRVGAAIMVAA